MSLETIRSVVREFARRDVAEDQSLFQSGLLDSFTLADMVAALEQKLGITVPDSDLNPQTFDSIRSIDAYVSTRAKRPK